MLKVLCSLLPFTLYHLFRCRLCGSVLFDEEIMAGWTAEDSNLNTKCMFCERLTVPTLTCRVADYRGNPPMSRPEVATSEDKVGEVADPLVCPHPPVSAFHAEGGEQGRDYIFHGSIYPKVAPIPQLVVNKV